MFPFQAPYFNNIRASNLVLSSDMTIHAALFILIDSCIFKLLYFCNGSLSKILDYDNYQLITL